MTTPPLDRFPNTSPPPANHHESTPFEVKIKAGGTVNFNISGLHQVVVYGDGIQPGDINPALTTPTTGTPAGVLLINDPDNRIYRGPDPSLLPRDRVEVVQFENPGTYLVICGVLTHFQQGMIGFVCCLSNPRPSDRNCGPRNDRTRLQSAGVARFVCCCLAVPAQSRNDSTARAIKDRECVNGAESHKIRTNGKR
jgi:plastocyanin